MTFNPPEESELSGRWLRLYQPWTRLLPYMDPWELLQGLEVVDEENCPTEVTMFLTQNIQIRLYDLTWSDTIVQLLRDLQTQATMGAVDMLARRIVRHGVPTEPIDFRILEPGIWFVSVDPPREDSTWAESQLAPELWSEAIRLLQLAGVLCYRNRKEGARKVEMTGSAEKVKGLFGKNWTKFLDQRGWTFELR